MSWLVWALAPLIAFWAQLAGHTSLRVALLTFAIGFANLLVVGASLANPTAYWKLTRFDLVCGGISLLALLLWVVTGQEVVAIICCILADLFASIPTITKAYAHPESEFGVVYFAGVVGAGLTLATIKHWVFASYGYSLYYLAIDLVLTVVILLPGRVSAMPVMTNIPDTPPEGSGDTASRQL